MHIHSKFPLACALSLTALLAACGGGGGGSAPATTSTSTGSTAPTSTNTGATTTPTYAAGSQELAALNQINAMRQQCGFSELSQNTLLDQAALNHMGYMADQKVSSHYESVTTDPNYTGNTPSARVAHVGYSSNGVGEVLTTQIADIGGANSVMALASVPYHLTGLFYPMAEIGIGYGALDFGPSDPAYTLLMDMATSTSGTPSGPTYPNTPLTFPCQGTTGVDYESAGAEDPTPYINGQPVDTGTNPIGTPITVMGNLSDTVRLTSGTLMGPNSNQIALNVTDSSTDPNKTLLSNTAFAFPTNPLQPNTTYSVILNGTLNGTPFSRNFSFTTGAQGQF